MLQTKTQPAGDMLRCYLMGIVSLLIFGCAGAHQSASCVSDRVFFADLINTWANDGKLEIIGELDDIPLKRSLLDSIRNSRPTLKGEAGIPDRCFILVTDQRCKPKRAYKFATYKNMFIPITVEFIAGNYKLVGYAVDSNLLPLSPPPIGELNRWAKGRGDLLKGRFAE